MLILLLIVPFTAHNTLLYLHTLPQLQSLPRQNIVRAPFLMYGALPPTIL
jgi:hypothetical protein